MEDLLQNTGAEKPKLTFKKAERLRSKKIIEQLFAEGESFLSFPVKIIFIKTAHSSPFPVQAGFSVGKKLFKSAVDRNTIKRKMREAYRLNKAELYSVAGETQIAVFFIFIGKTLPEYSQVETGMRKGIKKIIQKL